MLQYPAFMSQYPSSTRVIPTSFLLPAQWPQPHNDELLLAMEEAEYEEKVRPSLTEIFENILCYIWTLTDNYKLFPHRFCYCRRLSRSMPVYFVRIRCAWLLKFGKYIRSASFFLGFGSDNFTHCFKSFLWGDLSFRGS